LVADRIVRLRQLAFSGEFQFSRKLTPNILRDLPGLSSAPDPLLGLSVSRTACRAYKSVDLGEAVRMISPSGSDSGVVCASRIPDVLRRMARTRQPALSQYGVVVVQRGDGNGQGRYTCCRADAGLYGLRRFSASQASSPTCAVEDRHSRRFEWTTT
jgi:hypothetical protein